MERENNVGARLKSLAESKQKTEILHFAGESWSYGRLYERYLQICTERKLWKENGKTGIVLCMEDGVEQLLYYLAAVDAGMDAGILPAKAAPAEILLLCERINACGYVQNPGNLKPAGQPKTSRETEPRREVILRTGGTSGKPKPVRISHKNVIARALVCHGYEDKSSDRCKLLMIEPWTHLGLQSLLRAVFCGIVTCLPGHVTEERAFDSFRKYNITSLVIVSSMLEKLLHHKEFSLDLLKNLQNLCYVLEPMPPETLIKLQSLKPDIRVYSDYGLTETAGTVAVLGPKDHMDAVKNYHMPSVGKFLPGVKVRVSDQNGREVSLGEVGELMVHAPWQFEGYLGEEEPYWIATGDMGWMDREGYFYMSGFHTCLSPDMRGTLFILPAVARKHYTNIPVAQKKQPGMAVNEQQMQNLFMFIHGTLDAEEIEHIYLNMIPQVIRADAYGFELYEIDALEEFPTIYSGKWYQNSFHQISMRSILVCQDTAQEKYDYRMKLDMLEKYWGQPADILYIPLYSKKALLHGAVSFARRDGNRGFSSAELTFIKQISHHLNLAVLNARAFQELQMRQGLLQKTLDFTDTGIILSDLSATVYSMNNAAEQIMRMEDNSTIRGSVILENFCKNLKELKRAGTPEHMIRFACYFKECALPVSISMRTVCVQKDGNFAVTFLSQDLEQKKFSFGDLDGLLSKREMEVLIYLCRGLPYKEISQNMQVSRNTVNYHIKNIYKKMNVNSRAEIVNRVLYLGSNGVSFAQADAFSGNEKS